VTLKHCNRQDIGVAEITSRVEYEEQAHLPRKDAVHKRRRCSARSGLWQSGLARTGWSRADQDPGAAGTPTSFPIAISTHSMRDPERVGVRWRVAVLCGLCKRIGRGYLSWHTTAVSPCSFVLSATSQQYFSLRTNQPLAISQQYFSLRTNQHQPSATSRTNRLYVYIGVTTTKI
jgi:hypothetical protein